ncbi:hypothetical protein [Sphaerotilus uruguayifluvii]|nr:hypothetical protein [Leptothrix sp. C29]
MNQLNRAAVFVGVMPDLRTNCTIFPEQFKSMGHHSPATPS